MTQSVTKEEFESFIAEYESTKEHMLEQIESIRADFEKLKEEVDELITKSTTQSSEQSMWQKRLE